jgi:hypothetical protein
MQALHIVDDNGVELAKRALRHSGPQGLAEYAGGIVVAEVRADAAGTKFVHYYLGVSADGKPTIAAGQELLDVPSDPGVAAQLSVVQGRLFVRSGLTQGTATPYTTELRAEAVGDLWVAPPAPDWAAPRGEACLAEVKMSDGP